LCRSEVCVKDVSCKRSVLQLETNFGRLWNVFCVSS